MKPVLLVHFENYICAISFFIQIGDFKGVPEVLAFYCKINPALRTDGSANIENESSL